jgi:hypothetical protein
VLKGWSVPLLGRAKATGVIALIRLLPMNQPTPNDPRVELLEATISCQVEAVRELGAILDDLLATIEPPSPTPRGTVLVAGIGRARQTAEIIVELSKKRYVEDMAILSRTIVETAINTCYLQVCDEDEFKRFMIFDFIADLKLHRELKNASAVGIVGISKGFPKRWEADIMAFHAFHTLSFPWPAFVLQKLINRYAATQCNVPYSPRDANRYSSLANEYRLAI